MNDHFTRVVVSAMLALTLSTHAAGPQEITTPQDDLKALLRALESVRVDYTEPMIDRAEVDRRKAAITKAIADFGTSLADRFDDPKNASAFNLDVTVFEIDTAPRLTGNVIRVGPDRNVKSLDQVTPTSGDLIVLDPGEYELRTPASRGWADVAISGSGAEHTTLKATFSGAARLRLEGLDLIGERGEIANLQSGGGIQIRRCQLSQYNTGAGGSNALFAAGGASLLLVDCRFDGESGRAAGGAFGSAFDLREHYYLYARRCQFINNDEIERASSWSIYDGCVALNTKSRGDGVMLYLAGFNTWSCDSSNIVQPRFLPLLKTFSTPLDDPSVVSALTSVDAGPMDAETAARAKMLDLARRLPYWIALLRHEDESVRNQAAQRVTALTGLEIDLDRANIATVDELAVPLAADVEYAGTILWFEANRSRLRWNPDRGRYDLARNP